MRKFLPDMRKDFLIMSNFYLVEILSEPNSLSIVTSKKILKTGNYVLIWRFIFSKWESGICCVLKRYKRAQRSLISNTQNKAFVKYCNTSFYINSTILQLKLRKSCVVLFCFVFFHLLHDTCPYSEFSGSYFPAFGLNMEIYSVNLRIQSKCGKIRTKKTPSEYRQFLRSDPKIFFFLSETC